MSGDGYVDIVNLAVETSLQHMTTLTVSPLESQHAHSRSVGHASDAMIDCVPEPKDRVLELKEVHSFSEYHDSLEQDHGKIAKSYADFTIRHYG